MSALSNRIVERLLAAEIRESDVWFKDDYRQARICVATAAKGEPDPFLASSYAVYGTHPDHVWAKVMGNRRYRLGREFSAWFDQAGPSQARSAEEETRNLHGRRIRTTYERTSRWRARIPQDGTTLCKAGRETEDRNSI